MITKTYNWIKKRFIKVLIGLGIIGIAVASTSGTLSLEEKYDRAEEIKAEYQLEKSSLVKNIVKNPELVNGEPKDEIKVVVGEKNEENFKPNIEIKRWNEVGFKIKPRITADLKDQELEFIDNKIKWQSPEIEIEFEDFEDKFKFIWHLNKKPDSNKIEFDIVSEGLDFYYQPPLTEEITEEQIDKGYTATETEIKDEKGNVVTHRPENVVGSYAVYASEPKMNIKGGKKYRTGKVAHIYRPHIIDAEGKETWGILNIKNGIYSVEIPQDFLDKAVYPIKSNDTFGYGTVGGSWWDSGGTARMTGSLFTSPSDIDTVDSISVYGFTGSSNVDIKGILVKHSDLGIVNNGVGNAVAMPEGIGSANWVTSNFSTSPSISTSTGYVLMYINESYTSIRYDSGDTNQGHDDTSNNYSSPTDPTDASHNNNKFSIYATYTPSGGEEGAEAPQMQTDIIIVE